MPPGETQDHRDLRIWQWKQWHVGVVFWIEAKTPIATRRHKGPIRLSPMIRTTRAFFHPTHLAVHVSLLGFKLGQNAIESIRFFLFGIFSFLSLSFFFLFSAKGHDYVAGRETSNLVVRPDSTRLDPTLPGSPSSTDGIRCE